MFWPMMASAATCPNCGSKKYKEGEHCEACGFIHVKTVQSPDAYFIFCTKCGCHYTTPDGHCPRHGLDFVEKGKLPEVKPNPNANK